MFNHSNRTFKVTKKDRIAQLIITKIELASLEIVDEMSTTERGVNGFGSSGL